MYLLGYISGYVFTYWLLRKIVRKSKSSYYSWGDMFNVASFSLLWPIVLPITGIVMLSVYSQDKKPPKWL